ncbi:symmetrical bis(5'-nucleosyl)-tetraphosphatase [Limnobacter sp.]|jgi:bis(5'-nucleosyl)-tetraphosphatase (symmetrical)|uniref:symmetrical bis(5'-nucleosyl)-tetraphosphatase n=1 Tax=Limnobacter sp. TaxID=2003368 RepID=UPI002734D242|nr:symmetrical bis(5'-nucleosyl)-tetraphosphatase [Limnobacter sp.]MDP3273119.1 symmetrical bis(5'-nucleosyl)-tetraphosphatase [Limnobacter sp.]
MANYVIGDVQGCLDSLLKLLDKVRFNPQLDILWFAGDLVNRGPRSLDTLRFVRGLGQQAHTVLGNHDLHLLALWYSSGRSHESDTIAEVVSAPDGEELVNWLRSQPLALRLPPTQNTLNQALLTHAGILPQWSFDDALKLSNEVQLVLAGPDWQAFMAELYGNKPNRWDPELQGFDRLRLIVNVFTRMRMVRDDGKIDFKYKLEPADAPPELKPWFEFEREFSGEGPIVFGHWSTLGQLKNKAGYCLDTGCVWGGQLTALRLEDEAIIQVEAVEPPLPTIP